MNEAIVMDVKDSEINSVNGNGMAVPLVTVTISLFNYKKFILSCLDSVKAQTIKDLDLIVVDDCSNDGSPEIVTNWLNLNEHRFSSSKLIRHRANSGLAITRNTGFQNSRTKYVFVLDADNLLYPRCIDRLVNALENCEACFAYCYLEKFGKVNCLQNTKAWNPATLQFGNTIDAMVLLRKNVWAKIGGYSANQVMRLGWEDFELWFKIARIKGWGILVPEILARYRVHGNSMLSNVTNPNADKLWSYLKVNYPEFFPC
jgi:glycosyltransferase involved in cell wall biosynthesis